MNKGFLSDTVRDILTVCGFLLTAIGLTLSSIQLLATRNTPASGSSRKKLFEQRNQHHIFSDNYKMFISLKVFFGWILITSCTTLGMLYFRNWFGVILGFLSVILWSVEVFMIMIMLDDFHHHLVQRASSPFRETIWSIIFFCILLGILSLSMGLFLALTLNKPNHIEKVATLQSLSLSMACFFLLLIYIYSIAAEIFKKFYKSQ